VAARLTKRQADLHKESIRVSMLLNRLEDHALGKVDLTQTQVRAIDILLKKCLPDLKATEHTGADGGPVEISYPIAGIPSKQTDAE